MLFIIYKSCSVAMNVIQNYKYASGELCLCPDTRPSGSSLYYRQACASRRYCIYSVVQWSKNGFSPLAPKLLIGSKQLGGCKNGTDLLYHHAKYGGDRGSRAGCRRKSFLAVFVTLWNDKVCDNGNAMMQCNFQNSYGVIA